MIIINATDYTQELDDKEKVCIAKCVDRLDEYYRIYKSEISEFLKGDNKKNSFSL